MSTAAMRPQLEIRPAREEDAAPLCEIFNEAVHDHMEAFDSEARAVEHQRMLIAAAENDPKHPILVADVRNWIAGWVALGPYDSRIALERYGRSIRLWAAIVPQLRRWPATDARNSGSCRGTWLSQTHWPAPGGKSRWIAAVPSDRLARGGPPLRACAIE